MPNPDNLLTLGMYAKGDVHLPAKKDVINMPVTAGSYSAYGDFVYVVEGADTQLINTKHQVYVKTGERSDDGVVLLDGVRAHDRVVTSGQLRLSNGAMVGIAFKDTVGLDHASSR